MKIFVYKEYNDEAADGEEIIEVYSSKKDAEARLRDQVEHFYGTKLEDLAADYGITENMLNTVSKDYVSIEGFFWIIEEKELDEAVENPAEISSLITISSAHISDESAEMLDKEAEKNNLGLSVFKYEYGWRIYIPEESENVPENIPEDIATCMSYAAEHNCLWLTIDGDGETVQELPVYGG